MSDSRNMGKGSKRRQIVAQLWATGLSCNEIGEIADISGHEVSIIRYELGLPKRKGPFAPGQHVIDERAARKEAHEEYVRHLTIAEQIVAQLQQAYRQKLAAVRQYHRAGKIDNDQKKKKMAKGLREEGVSLFDIAAELGVTVQTVKNWLRQR